MSNFVNIRLPDNLLIDPNLKVLVDKLAIDNPKWVFEPRKGGREIHQKAVNFKFSASEETQKANTAPEGFSFVRAIHVLQDGEQLGVLHVDNQYNRSREQNWHYGVQSWRVEKSRGDRNTTHTTKLDMAIRHVKKTFKPMDHNETYTKAVDAIHRGFQDALRNLTDPIRNMRLIKSNVSLQAYALAKALGEPILSPDLTEIERQLQSATYKQAMGEYFLARDMGAAQDRQLTVVVALGNNQYLFKDAEYELHCADFDTLPERMQNNLSVMHLMQDNEVVRDVGYRYNDTHFYIHK
jgi:hypothetical protein